VGRRYGCRHQEPIIPKGDTLSHSNVSQDIRDRKLWTTALSDAEFFRNITRFITENMRVYLRSGRGTAPITIRKEAIYLLFSTK
jgi:hypothetical protein